jgi:hypothetical protein
LITFEIKKRNIVKIIACRYYTFLAVIQVVGIMGKMPSMLSIFLKLGFFKIKGNSRFSGCGDFTQAKRNPELIGQQGNPCLHPGCDPMLESLQLYKHPLS